MNTEFKYRTFDDLVSSVSLDLRRFDLENMIDPQSLIKVALRINHLLGVKVSASKEKVLTVHKGKAKLPADFDVLNFAFVLSGSTACDPEKEYTYINPHCAETQTITNDCGEDIIVSPHIKLVYETYSPTVVAGCQIINPQGCKLHKMEQIRMVRGKRVASDCHNLTAKCRLEGYIQDNFLVTNFEDGEIYINYQSLMEDDNGRLLVLDHPRVNDFYEYSLKERIMENLIAESEEVIRLYQLYSEKARQARIEALSYIRTPNFGEMRDTWELNRRAMTAKYYSMFR